MQILNKEIENYENYIIFEDGRIFNRITNKYLNPYLNKKNGYFCVDLYNKDGKKL